MNLLELNLSGHAIDKIENLCALKKLQRLVLSGNRISKLEGLGHLRQLEHLDVSANTIAEIPFSLTKNNRLIHLNLSSNIISRKDALVTLRSCPKLQTLLLEGNNVASMEGYMLFMQNLVPQLRILDGAIINRVQQSRQRLAKKDTTLESGAPMVCHNQSVLAHNQKAMSSVARNRKGDDTLTLDCGETSSRFNLSEYREAASQEELLTECLDVYLLNSNSREHSRSSNAADRRSDFTNAASVPQSCESQRRPYLYYPSNPPGHLDTCPTDYEESPGLTKVETASDVRNEIRKYEFYQSKVLPLVYDQFCLHLL